MFDLMMKVMKKKFGKPEPEEPSREYMRLELEEVCALHAMEADELKRMSSTSLYSFLGPEDARRVEITLARMRELWDVLPSEQKAYLSSPDKEVVAYDELSREFQEKEYLMLDQELEAEAGVYYLKYHELVQMEPKKMLKLLGKERFEEFQAKRKRALELWNGLTFEQKDRNSLKRPDRMY